jgi:hypothetical protein
MNKRKCVLSLDEIELMNEYLELFEKEKNRQKIIQQMAEKREGTDKLDLTLRILTLGQRIYEILAEATKAYLDSCKEEIELLKYRAAEVAFHLPG